MTTTAKIKKYLRPEKTIGGALHNIIIQYRDREPLGPHVRKFVQHCGHLVRDRLPISAREWKQKINEPHGRFVSDLDKN